MNNYYLKINIVHKNNKKYFKNCELYKKNKLIKTYDKDITKTLYKYLKQEHIDIDKYNNYLIINNEKFIDKYLGLPAKKVLHINPYASMAIALSSIVFTTGGIKNINHITNTYNESSVSTNEDIDDTYIYEEEPLKIDNTNIELVYQPSQDISNNSLVYSNDSENQLENSTNESIILSDNEIDNSCIYEFENDDRSNDKCVKLIDLVYGNDIKPLAKQYGFDYSFILADICQENKDFVSRNSTQGGVGPMQVEWYIWDGQSLPDIDGNNYTFNCSELNNISSDFDKMFEVSLYKHIFEDKDMSREQLEEHINSYLDITKDEYNDKTNYLNEYLKIIDNTTSFEEAKEQTLSYFNINDENIKQFKNAIEGVKAGQVILHYNLNEINKNNKNNIYNYNLANNEIGLFTIWSQNKGSTCINDCLKVTFDKYDTEEAIKRTPYGDNEYLSNVFSYIKDGTVIHMKLDDGNTITIKPQNLTLSNSITK